MVKGKIKVGKRHQNKNYFDFNFSYFQNANIEIIIIHQSKKTGLMLRSRNSKYLLKKSKNAKKLFYKDIEKLH